MAGQKRREVERASIPGNRFEPGLAEASDCEPQKCIRQAMHGRDARQCKACCHQMSKAYPSFFATIWLRTFSRLVVIESELRVVARM